MFLINFSNPYIDLAEVDRIIDLAAEINAFKKLFKNIKDIRFLFAREQYNKNAISGWNYFRNVIIQRYSKINKNELNLAGKILSEIFDKVRWLLPKENIYWGGDVGPLIYNSYSKKNKSHYGIRHLGIEKTAPLSIINLPAEEVDCFWHWSILGHETGHYLWLTIKGFKEGLLKELKQIFRTKIGDDTEFQQKEKIIESWCEEFFADTFAVLTFDAAAILTTMHFCYKETYWFYANNHPPIKYRILLQLYILKWLETRPIPNRVRKKCSLYNILLHKWKIITHSYQDSGIFDKKMAQLLGHGEESAYTAIIKDIAKQIINYLEALPLNKGADHLFAGCSDRVMAMINEIIPLMQDFNSQNWDDFIKKYFNRDEIKKSELREIADHMVEHLNTLIENKGVGHLFTGSNSKVFTMVRGIIPLMLDYDSQKWDDFIKDHFNHEKLAGIQSHGSRYEDRFKPIIKEIADHMTECLKTLLDKGGGHLFTGISEKVFTMINEIILLLLDFDYQKWKDFIENRFYRDELTKIQLLNKHDKFLKIHLLTAAAFAFEHDHTKKRDIQENILYRLKFPENEIEPPQKKDSPEPCFDMIKSASLNGLKENCSDRAILERFHEMQCACLSINFIPTDETRQVVDLALRTIDFDKRYTRFIDNIQTDYLEKLVYLNEKIKTTLREQREERRNNQLWKINEINKIFKPVLNIISQWRYYREVVLQNYAGTNRPETGKIYLFFKNIIKKINCEKFNLSSNFNYLIRMCYEDPNVFIDTIEELELDIPGNNKFHKDTTIINFPYSEMQNVWHWGLIAYHVACLFYKFNPCFAEAIKEAIDTVDYPSEFEKRLKDFFYMTARKTQANIFALKALGPSYALCLLHLLEINYFYPVEKDDYSGLMKNFEIKCQLLFTIYACNKLYKNWNTHTPLTERFSYSAGDFYQNFSKYLNLWHGVVVGNKETTCKEELITCIDQKMIGLPDYKKGLKDIIQTKNLKLLIKKINAAQYILKTEPGKNIDKTPLNSTFKKISEEITDTILNTRLSSEKDSTYKNLITFNDFAEDNASNITSNFINGIPLYNRKFDSCHFLAGTIMAYDHLVNESPGIIEIKNIITSKDKESEKILQEINSLMPDIKKIEKSTELKNWIHNAGEHKRLITAFREIMKKLDWIRIAFYHSSLDVTVEAD